jgi:hypothetical protein
LYTDPFCTRYAQTLGLAASRSPLGVNLILRETLSASYAEMNPRTSARVALPASKRGQQGVSGVERLGPVVAGVAVPAAELVGEVVPGLARRHQGQVITGHRLIRVGADGAVKASPTRWDRSV